MKGYPPEPIERGLRGILAELDPRHPLHSQLGRRRGHRPRPVPGHAAPFTSRRAPPPKLTSELGMPNIVTMDSLRQMMPEEARWPQGDVWGMHDFSLAARSAARRSAK
jgi:hypothetical protein